MPSATTQPAAGEQGDVVTIGTVLVVGAGTMGSGIAQVVAQSGIQTFLYDADAPALERALKTIPAAWERAVAKGRLRSEQVEAAASSLTAAGSLDAAAEVELVIEAIIEEVAVKEALFARLAELSPAGTILASNTSSLSITRLGAAAGAPERVVGLHFFNPVPRLPLVEIVRGLGTADETIDRAVAFAQGIGKTPIVVADGPGFVANRVLVPMINEAIFVLGEGVADAAAIDEVMRLGASHPMGPLALADLIGLDVCLAIMETLQRDLGDDKYRPAPLLRRLVAAGRLGHKTGIGFHQYSDDTG